MKPAKQLRAAQVADGYGFTPRYWIRLAAQGRVPGAWQPSGAGGGWLFDEQKFLAWREQNKPKVAPCPTHTVEEKSTGVVLVSSGEASRQQIEQLLKRALSNGATNATPAPGATSRDGRSMKRPKSSSLST